MESMTGDQRRCTGECKELKPVSEFGKKKRWCKSCTSEYQRKWRKSKQGKELVKTQKRRYRQKPKSKRQVAEYNRQYYLKHTAAKRKKLSQKKKSE